ELKNELLSMIKQGISRSQASREIAKNTGLSRRYLYQLALTIEINL
ncbi:MAG: rRNA (cytidine-2'-O-)-methyltransferase, partial [Dolichospermum sp.]